MSSSQVVYPTPFPPPPPPPLSHSSRSHSARPPSSISENSHEPPNPYLQRKNFPLFSALVESPEYLATLARTPSASYRYRFPHYSSYNDDATSRRRSAPQPVNSSSLKGKHKSKPLSTRPHSGSAGSTAFPSLPPPVPPLPAPFQSTSQFSAVQFHDPRQVRESTQSADLVLTSLRSQQEAKKNKNATESPVVSRDWIHVSQSDFATPTTQDAGSHLFSNSVFEVGNKPRVIQPRGARPLPVITTPSSPPLMRPLPLAPEPDPPTQNFLEPPKGQFSSVSNSKLYDASVTSSRGSFSRTLGTLKRMLSSPSRRRKVSSTTPETSVPVSRKRWSIVVPRAQSPTSMMSFDVENTSLVIVGDAGAQTRRSSSGTTLTSLYNRGTPSSVSSDAFLSRPTANESTVTLPTSVSYSSYPSPTPKAKPFPPNPFLFNEFARFPSPPPPAPSSPAEVLEFPSLVPTRSLPDLPTSVPIVDGWDGGSTYQSYGSKWEVPKELPKELKARRTGLARTKGAGMLSSRTVWGKWIVWVNEARMNNGVQLRLEGEST